MGMFDFLKGRMGPAGQAPVMATGPAGDIGPLAQPPTMQHQPGFLERQRMPGPDGISMADRLLMGMMSLNGNTEGALGYAAGKKKEAKSTSDRTRKNAALKAAYDPVTGKFDPAKYIEAAGPEADASEAFAIQKDLAGKAGVDEGVAYNVDPNGQVHWGEQRPRSYADTVREAQVARQEKRDEAQAAYWEAMAKVAGQNAGTNSYRAHKPHAGGSGQPSWLPPGSKLIHVPGE